MSEVAIKVAVRIRPFGRRELEQNQKRIVRALDSSTLIFDPDEDEDEFFFHGAKQTHRDITKRVKKKLNMDFDNVLNEEKTNEEVFEICTKPIVQSTLNGFNCSVFVYGATGAGKTFTMLGSETNPGITFLTMQELFSQIEMLSEERKFDIGISYLEVYNELVMNLLTKSGPLKLREDASGVIVGGLVLKQIHSAEELFDLLILGNKNRTQHPTDANEESSRSHAIFQVHIRMTDKRTSVRRTVKLSMIDLAGSERAQSTKCKGLRFKEGANINKSLLALGNCINKLSDGAKHIPYRDSNLTRILKDSLGGNCQTLMIANISPSSLTYEDTYNTLKYASRAKKIRNTLKQNVVSSNMPKEFLLKKCNDQVSTIESLKAENEKLRERNKMLESQLLDQNILAKKSAGAMGDSANVKPESDLTRWYAKIDSTYANFNSLHEKCLSLQSNEKILSFRIRNKEKYEEIRTLLPLDGSSVQQDLARLTASIDKYTKEVERIKSEELLQNLKKFKEATRELNFLKSEIQRNEKIEALNTYMRLKDLELERSKTFQKMTHVNKINSIYHVEVSNYQNALSHSVQILQDKFLVLRSLNEIDNKLLDNLAHLGRLLLGQRSVKFADGKASNTSECSNFEGISDIQNIMNLTDFGSDETSSSPVSAKKRANEDLETEKESKKSKPSVDFPFARPKAVQSINFNSASTLKAPEGPNNNHDMNITFNLEQNQCSSSSLTALVERSNKVSSVKTAPSALKLVKQTKSSGSVAKYALNVNKENKKYSPARNRVKKLTRTPNLVSGSKDHRPKLIISATTATPSLVIMGGKDKFAGAKK